MSETNSNQKARRLKLEAAIVIFEKYLAFTFKVWISICWIYGFVMIALVILDALTRIE